MTQEAQWADLFSGANALRTLVMCSGVALHAINVYVGTTILPSVVRDIGGLEYYAWNTTLFIVASILGSAFSVRLLQGLGPKGAFVSAALVFGIGTLTCAVAQSMPVMLVGRFVQGLGGGFLLALSYAMIRLVFDERLWPRAMALDSAMWGLATLAGPAIGGAFANAGAWRAAFWTLIPVTALFGVAAMLVLPRRRAVSRGRSRVAIPQLLLLTGAVIAVSVGSIRHEALWNVGAVATAVGLIGLLVRVESRAARRLLPRGSLHINEPLGALYATLSLLAATVTSTEIFVPVFLQTLHATSPLVAGYLAALMAAGWTLGSVASSGSGARRVAQLMRAAPLLAFVGMILLTVLIPEVSGAEWRNLAPICLALGLVGFGVGLAWPHLLARVLQVAESGEQDLASSSITTVQLFATAFAAALAGMVANFGGLISPGGEAGTADAAFWLFAAFALAPVLCGFTVSRLGSARSALARTKASSNRLSPGAPAETVGRDSAASPSLRSGPNAQTALSNTAETVAAPEY